LLLLLRQPALLLLGQVMPLARHLKQRGPVLWRRFKLVTRFCRALPRPPGARQIGTGRQMSAYQSNQLIMI
jgi:hypothetical protein